MRTRLFLCMALLVSGCEGLTEPYAVKTPEYTYKPIPPLHSREEEARLKLAGDVLLSKWTRCEMNAAVVIARTSKGDPADGAQLALTACPTERQAWVDSQVAIGWPRQASEEVADGSQRCLFPMVEAQIEMTRRNATTQERQQWVIAHAGDSCNNQ